MCAKSTFGRVFNLTREGVAPITEAIRSENGGLGADLCIECSGAPAAVVQGMEILSAQDEICREDEGFLMLTDISSDLNAKREYMNPKVKGHYSAKGLECLGRAAAETLGNIR